MPRAFFLLMRILYACFATVTSFYCYNKWCLESNDNLNPVLMLLVRKNENNFDASERCLLIVIFNYSLLWAMGKLQSSQKSRYCAQIVGFYYVCTHALLAWIVFSYSTFIKCYSCMDQGGIWIPCGNKLSF